MFVLLHNPNHRHYPHQRGVKCNARNVPAQWHVCIHCQRWVPGGSVLHCCYCCFCCPHLPDDLESVEPLISAQHQGLD